MALIGNPFIATVPKQMSNEDLAQALRLDIAGEYEAIIGYEAHAMATTDERAKKILYHIADEERQHVGELQQLLSIISPNKAINIEKGKHSVQEQESQNFKSPIQ
ncbi:MAG: demethoxyubiquinone hydroxylase family protein [Vulcanibacillus sp.]